MNFETKAQLLRQAMSNPRLSARAKLTLWALADCANNLTGKCNPRRATIAAMVGMGERTVKRGLSELRQAGLIVSKQTRGAPYYSFPMSQVANPKPAPRWGDKTGRLGGQHGARGIAYRNIIGFKGQKSWAAVRWDYQQQYGAEAFSRYCAEMGVA
jgi:hypothetical protein